jgi:hypothetical protein
MPTKNQPEKIMIFLDDITIFWKKAHHEPKNRQIAIIAGIKVFSSLFWIICVVCCWSRKEKGLWSSSNTQERAKQPSSSPSRIF